MASATSRFALQECFCCERITWRHKTQSFAYLWGDTERGGDTLRGGDLLPLRAGLLDLDADLEADLQLKHASCHTQDALTEIARAEQLRGLAAQQGQGQGQQLRGRRSTAGSGRGPTVERTLQHSRVRERANSHSKHPHSKVLDWPDGTWQHSMTDDSTQNSMRNAR